MNEIIHGDCLKVMEEITTESVDLVLTDPPYRLNLGGGEMRGIFSKSLSDNVSNGKLFDHNEIDFQEWIPEVYRVLKDAAHFYCFINCHHVQEVIEVAEQSGFILNNILVMVKDNTVVNRWYMKNVEYVLFFRKGNAAALNSCSDNTAIFVKMPKDAEKIHPTQKPVKYLEMLVKNSSNAGEIVFDPFCGSASTAIACINTGRNYITCELDDVFFKKATKRINDHWDFMNGQLLAF